MTTKVNRSHENACSHSDSLNRVCFISSQFASLQFARAGSPTANHDDGASRPSRRYSRGYWPWTTDRPTHSNKSSSRDDCRDARPFNIGHCFPSLYLCVSMAIRAAVVGRYVCFVGSVWTSSCCAMSSKAAIAQLRSTGNKLDNLVKVATCARMAKELGAAMLFLPECFGFIGESSQQTLEYAEPPIMIDSVQNNVHVQELLRKSVQSPFEGVDSTVEDENVSLLDGLKVIAKESGLWISGGGMHESGAPTDEDDRPRVYNSHVILDSDGNVQALYRKTHLFDVSIPNKVNLRESATTAPGTELVVCDSPVGKDLVEYEQ